MNDPIVAPAAPAAGPLPGVDSDSVREFGLHPRVGELWFWQWLVVAVVMRPTALCRKPFPSRPISCPRRTGR